MEKQVFKVGSVVRLKSGGDKMTIRGISKFGIETNWFSVNGDESFDSFLRSGTFNIDTLEVVNE